jgi:predicted dinucleotide-binding enzyme
MRIAVIGRGNVGGGLADRWERAGHTVDRIGRDGGDVSGADGVVVAVPSNELESALERVDGIQGKTAIDATNGFRGRDESYPSLAHQVKALVGGHVAKAFNLNFAVIYDELDGAAERPGNLYAADDAAREVTEQLTRDAGYDPIYAGSLENARLLEEHLALMFAVNQAGLGPFFYRYWSPRR